jgi:DUF971 family protein
MSAAPRPWPTELRVKRAARLLEIDFDDGASFSLPAEYLRVMTPSAEDRGHGAGPGRTVHGKKDVGIKDVTPIGRYAVRIDFTDGHDTGLYSWDELHRLGRDQIKLWGEFLQRMKKEGLSRER